jgi:predicted metalloprotease
MRWIGRRQSTNVEDSRGTGGGKILGGGIGAVVIAVIVYLLGGDPSQLLNQSPSMPQTQEEKAVNDSAAAFVGVVLADTEDVWNKIFEDVWNKIFKEKYGRDYKEPTLQLFSGSIASACGRASSTTGPFYCPLDEKVYIDGSFYSELHNRFGAPGDFAMAYVVVHEVGHHVQHLLGISDKVHQLQQNSSEEAGNSYSVKLELQADSSQVYGRTMNRA